MNVNSIQLITIMKLQEGQDGPILLTCVPDKRPLGGAIFYHRSVI